MKYVYIITNALEEIRKQKFIHSVLILTIFVCTILFNLVSVLLLPAYMDISTLYGFKNKDIYVAAYSRENDAIDFFNSNLNTYKKLSEIDNVRVGWTFSKSLRYGIDSYRAVFYTDILCENINLLLKDGDQISEYNSQYIPVILPSDHPLLRTYNIGSTLSLELTVNGKPIVLDVQVCGILAENAKYYEGNNLNSVDYASILQSVNDDVIFLPDFELTDSTYLSENVEDEMINAFWYCEITSPKGSAEYNAAYSELCKICSVSSFREIIVGTWRSYSEGIADILLIGFFIMLLSAVGIGSANIYIGNNQIRSFAINFICGAKWTDCLVIDIIRNLSIIVVPTLLGSTVSYVAFKSQLPQSLTFSYLNLGVIFVFMLILFTISSLPYIIKLKKTEPITFVRTMSRE